MQISPLHRMESAAAAHAAPPPPDAPAVVLEAGRATARYWSDVWHYRELAAFLAWRDIRVRYKQAALGASWAVIQPAIQTVLLTFVFGKLAGMPAPGGVPYPLLVLCGLIPWQLFTAAFTGAGNSLVGNTHLISKVYFPRLVVPLSALGVALIDFAIVLGLALPLVTIFHGLPDWRLALLPVFVLLALLIALGAGLWISALTVRFRDFRFITPFLLQIGLFATPIGYSAGSTSRWQHLLAFNPLSGVIDGVRWSLLGGQTPLYLPGLALSVLAAFVLLATGIGYFRRTERHFADII
jgi:lipopolysaccharide transport system permease protein